MKRFIDIRIFACAAVFCLQACSDSFLDLKPRGTDLESNYYRNRQEAYNGLVAIYDVVGFQSATYITKLLAVSAASDDHFAGGGGASDLPNLQAWSNYTLSPAVGPQEDLWRRGFMGVARANILLEKLPDIPMDDVEKARFAAEAKFLRAYFYFDLIRLFKNIPLMDHSLVGDEIYEVVQAAPAEIYGFMEQDLNEAIPDLPITVNAPTEAGRASQGTAKALLGKVYLQQEKFTDAAQQLADVNGNPGQTSQYGYRLLDNYGDLFRVDNKFNSESIFEISFTNTSIGDWECIECTEGNVLNILVGPRNYNAGAGAADYVAGWGFLPVAPSLFEAIHYDPRNQHTVINMDSLQSNGVASYEAGYMNTGFFLEKFAGRESDRWTGPGSFELNFPQNVYDIRLADTYLLEAEALVRGSGDLGRAAALLNAVRNRVGLGPITANMENIKRERRLELAGEGHRWFDLVRWGDAPGALSGRGFVSGRHEILPIPLLEMDNTSIEQSIEYGGTK